MNVPCSVGNVKLAQHSINIQQPWITVCSASTDIDKETAMAVTQTIAKTSELFTFQQN